MNASPYLDFDKIFKPRDAKFYRRTITDEVRAEHDKREMTT